MYQGSQAKKLVSVLATSLSITGAIKKALKVKLLNKVLCRCYPVQFRKEKNKDVLALLDFRSEVNAMTPTYAVHLGLKVRVTNDST